MPFDLTTASDERISQLGRTTAVADVPLTAGDDFERLVALLVERDGVSDRLDLTDEVTGVDEHLRNVLASSERGLSRQRFVVGLRIGFRRFGDPLGHFEIEAAAAVDHRAGRQIQLAPPGHVGEVAEGADHGDARALIGLRQLMGADLNADAEERRDDVGAEQ